MTLITTPVDTPFTIAGREFSSRLMLGTGKYRTNEEMRAALDAGRKADPAFKLAGDGDMAQGTPGKAKKS